MALRQVRPGRLDAGPEQHTIDHLPVAGLGGIAGTVLGVLARVGYATSHGWPVVLSLLNTAAAFTGAILVGVVAGVYPCLRTARLNPTEALAAT